jgi:hypothetical protein
MAATSAVEPEGEKALTVVVLEDAFRAGGWVDGLDFDGRKAVVAAVVVVAKVDGDSVQPGLGRCVEGVEILEQPQENFLANILRVFHAAEQAVGGSEHLLLVRRHQFREDGLPGLIGSSPVGDRQGEFSRLHRYNCRTRERDVALRENVRSLTVAVL